MIQLAFRPEFWNSDAIFDENGAHIGNGTPEGPNQFALMEQNFSLIWGLAVMCYEATLVSNQTRFDQYLAGNENALTPEEENGMDAFYSGGTKCSKCHSGPLLSAASWGQLNTDTDVGIGPVVSVETNADDGFGDKGFFNIGLRPSGEDIGRAGVGDQTWASRYFNGSTVHCLDPFTPMKPSVVQTKTLVHSRLQLSETWS